MSQFNVWVEIEECDDNGDPIENSRDLSPLLEGVAAGSFTDLDRAIEFGNLLQAVGERMCVDDVVVLTHYSTLPAIAKVLAQRKAHELGLCGEKSCELAPTPISAHLRRFYTQLVAEPPLGIGKRKVRTPSGHICEIRADGLYLISDLDLARAGIAGLAQRTAYDGGWWTVEIGYSSDIADGFSDWGKGLTAGEAWRYALGSHYGSYQDEVVA